MNDLMIFKNEEFGKLKNIKKDNDYMGFFYAIEYGELIKIGSTNNPYQRVMTLKRQAEKYGNIKMGNLVLSKQHTNYFENERKLHTYYKNKRKNGTELFNITIDEFCKNISKTNIEYKNQTKDIENRSEKFCNMMKFFILGGNVNG